MLDIAIVRLDPELPLPAYAHEGDAGIDLFAREDALLPAAGGRYGMPTGIALALPVGYGGFVLPRSGLSLKHGVTVVNAPGLIDSGYRGEVRVLLLNTDRAEPFEIAAGDRIAQLVIVEIGEEDPLEADSLEESLRGDGGFGSTGRR
jgi:dUTP pyrophosphatase